MLYISTRGQAPSLSFEQAMMTGLARDGGLYVPETVPVLTHAQIADMAGASYEEIAFAVMRPFIGDAFTDAEFRALIAAAYRGFGHAARAPLVQLGPNHFLLELFHGPTLAFKDFAMQLIGADVPGRRWRGRATASPSSGPPRAIPARRRSRPSGVWAMSMCSSSTRMAACPRCSAAR